MTGPQLLAGSPKAKARLVEWEKCFVLFRVFRGYRFGKGEMRSTKLHETALNET